MHFSKTYAQLLLDLPPDLRDNAVQYREVRLIPAHTPLCTDATNTHS